MHSFERERLLSDIIEDADYVEFRHGAFVAARREIRRKRRRGRVAAWLGLAAALALVAVFWQPRTEAPVAAVEAPAMAPRVMQPDETPKIALVETQPIPVLEVVRTVPNKGITVETPKIARYYQVVHTRPGYLPHINDTQLFALFGDQRVGLLETGSGKELILFE